MIFALGSLVAAGAQEGEVTAVENVDLQRYAGTWYEIARFPNWFQRGCAGEVTATYELRDDGRIDVINRCVEEDGDTKEAKGIAKLRDDDGPASQLKVRFAPGFLTWLWFVWADYWVLALDEEYRYAAVGTPNRDYLWILSRTPTLDEASLRSVVESVAAMGFETDRLVTTRQGQ